MLRRSCFFLLMVVAAVGRAAPDLPRWQVFQHEHVLGTSLELKFVAASDTVARAAETAALAEIDRLARILSGYDAASEFSRWAATREVAVPVSPELFEVLSLFDTWRQRTSGALDASAEVASRLWKSAARDQRVPSTDELRAAVAAVQQVHWRLDSTARTATHVSDAPLILNSFAKSYIIGRAAAAALGVSGLRSVVVNIGGDLIVLGPDAEIVGIADPTAAADNDAPLTYVRARERAIATSGGYRRGVEIAGRWYSHLLDPRTGQPVDHILSATVIAPRATDAGALATALCVLSPAEGVRLASQFPDVDYLILTRDGRRLSSAGWPAREVSPSPVHAAAAATPDETAKPSPGAWDPSFELLVNLQITSASGGRGKRPFVAVWIEDKDHFPVRTLALWFNGPRWLPDLRSWYRGDQLRAMAEGTQIVASVSSATRGPGSYTLKWDGKDSHGQPVPKGKYTVFVEAAREHGTHQLHGQEIDFNGQPQHIDAPANLELSALSFEYRRKR